MKLRDDQMIVPKKTDAEHASEAAIRTAHALRGVALSPAIQPADKPVMLMMALGWEEYARQLVAKDSVARGEPALVSVN